MKIKLGVGIPTYNRYDLLEPSLRKYCADFPSSQIYIVDNGHQNIVSQDNLSIRQNWDAEKIKSGDYKPEEHSWAGITVMENQENIGVGASWNQLCQKIFETCEYALILNDDIYLGKKYEQICKFIEKKNPRFVRATPDWCVFIIHKSVYEQVGTFDECFFPAYYEDKSYEYRMKLKGIPILKHPELNPELYRSSQSLEKEPKILQNAKRNRRLYIEMWGGEPGEEKYTRPFKSL
jgi:GT2 family glycosyltransferase